MNFNLSRIPSIHFGPGKLKSLPELAKPLGNRVLLVTGHRFLSKSGILEKLLDQFKKSGYAIHYVSLNGEPTPEFVNQSAQLARDENMEFVISIGGGSVIDAGKAISAMATQEKPVQTFLEGVGTGEKHNGAKLPFIAIPTTSGTGSEATKNAVISRVGPQGFKKSLRHDHFVPDIALVDPELSMSCPAFVTATTGLDATTQLLEAYVSTQASPMTDAFAWSGLEAASQWLIPAYEKGHQIEARTGMSYAALTSGIALANAGLGLVHGLASTIGGYFNIPHGVVCGTLCAETTKQNISMLQQSGPDSAALHKYARAGRRFSGINDVDDLKAAGLLIDVLEKWTDHMHIPKLSGYGIKEKDLAPIVDKSGQKNNPVKLSRETITNILINRL